MKKIIFNRYIIDEDYFYYFKIILFTIFIFFFDLGIDNPTIFGINLGFLDARILLLLLIPVFFYDLLNLEKKKRIIFYFIIFWILIILHALILSHIKNIDNNNIYFFKLFFSLIYISIIAFYVNFILKNILKLIELFLIFYFIFITINVVINFYQNEILCLVGCFSQNREIYKEASHMGYISPILIIYYLNVVPFSKVNLIFKLLMLFFFISILNNLSTTLIAAIVISSLIILITNFRNIVYKKQFIFITVFFILIIPFEKNTIQKFAHFYNFKNFTVTKNLISKKFINEENKSNKEENKSNKIVQTNIKKEIIPKIKNLSIATLITNIKISMYSIKNDFLGWGIHNYKSAHKAYVQIVHTSNVKGSSWLNRTDGTNNFNKGLVEFGILFFIPILMIIFLLFDRKISINNKLLIFPILFSQTFIRGSGFFNGGYIVFLIILISIYFTNLKVRKK